MAREGIDYPGPIPGPAGLWIAMARGECLRALLFLWRWHRRDWRRSHLLAL
ncbi:hypothetical protein [Lawsonibacter hominis]|uniref:Uncharacterized protein n=1 Tax=Lawsonibacter hominis TaxID=2763053 RepID=A0A8J6J5L3_9FIRM|nr:hypothetical protein [Lawsonibacter hominis]MBC5733151.1 hypothetical protein [Lawsonibacter hominis]